MTIKSLLDFSQSLPLLKIKNLSLLRFVGHWLLPSLSITKLLPKIWGKRKRFQVLIAKCKHVLHADYMTLHMWGDRTFKQWLFSTLTRPFSTRVSKKIKMHLGWFDYFKKTAQSVLKSLILRSSFHLVFHKDRLDFMWKTIYF